MKKILSLLVMLWALGFVYAQKYVHYYMNDGTFNGFYTDKDVEVTHELDADNNFVTALTINGNKYIVPVENIDSIVVEDALVSSDFTGDYRIYEGTFDDLPFKRLIVDTRACLLASKNGDYGANDTILYASAYNNEKVLLITNEDANIQKVFCNNRLYYIDYENSSIADIIELTEKGYVAIPFIADYSAKVLKAPPVNERFLSNLSRRILDILGQGINQLIHNVNEISNNPELHRLKLGSDVASLIADGAGIAASFVGGSLTAGATWAGIGREVASLIDDTETLLQDIFPDAEQMERYKDYYKNKYDIALEVWRPSNVESDKADLRGKFSASNGIKGDLYFTFSKLTDTEDQKIAVSPEQITQQSYGISVTVSELEPKTCYYYNLVYECTVNGLHFVYRADNGVEFTTRAPTPIAKTLGIEKVTDTTAIVKCSYSNVPEGAICGVEYGSSTGTKRQETISGNGTQSILLSDLEPGTSYAYRAYIIATGNKFYEGDILYFDTRQPDISGTWTCIEKVLYCDTTYLYLPQQRIYSVTITPDDTLAWGGRTDYPLIRWYNSKLGNLDIEITTYYVEHTDNYANNYIEWFKAHLTADVAKKPSRFTGSINYYHNDVLFGTVCIGESVIVLIKQL